MDQRLRSIRLVTERYRDLQGLRMVSVGLAFISCFGTLALLGAPGGTAGLTIAAVAAIALGAPGVWLAERYYVRRFGRVVQDARHDWTTWRVVAFSASSSLLNNWLGVGPMTFALTIVGPLSLWVAIRDWPLRWYYVLSTMVCAGAFWLVIGTAPEGRPMAEALAMILLGIVSIPIGWLDHRLLTAVMPAATRSSAPDTERSTDRA